jgi:hypothetical protein
LFQHVFLPRKLKAAFGFFWARGVAIAPHKLLNLPWRDAGGKCGGRYPAVSLRFLSGLIFRLFDLRKWVAIAP